MSAEQYHPEVSDDTASWYILRDKNRHGPICFLDLLEAINLRLVHAGDLVWNHRWPDWRQIKSLPYFSSLPALMDCPTCVPKAPIPMSALVEKLNLEIRPTASPTAKIKPFLSRQKFTRVTNLFLLGAAIVVLLGLTTLIFGNRTEGVAITLVEFATLLILGITAISKSSRRNITYLCLCSLIAALLLVVKNLDQLPDALDAWQAKRWLAHARTSEQVRRLVSEHPSNRFIRFALAASDATDRSFAATVQLIDDVERNGITLDTLRASATADQLEGFVQELHAAEGRARSAMASYALILETERSVIEQAGHAIYPSDPLRLVPRVVQTISMQEDVLRERMGRMFDDFTTFYSHKKEVAEVLAKNWNEYKVARSTRQRSIFSDQTINYKYNRLISDVRAAQPIIISLKKDNLKFNASRHATWGDA